ncbi:MAG TPA: hypothetical protein VGN23_13090 [Verrucomicrobiae bacterium]|jgi:hypothetical protein
MKKSLLTISLVAGLAACVHAQGSLGSDGSFTSGNGTFGSFTLDNTANSNGSELATSGGLVWIGNTFNTAALLNQDVNIAVFNGGTDLNANLIVSLLMGAGDSGAANGDGTAYGGGVIIDNSTTTYYDTASVGGASTTLTMDLWTGDFSTLAAALASGQDGTSITWTQSLGDLAGAPAPSAPADFTGMPSAVLTPSPEPATLAFAGLGGLSLLAMRRRKS